MRYIKKFNESSEESNKVHKGTIIDGIEYPISERDFDYLQRGGWSNYAYVNNSDNFNDKRNIRVYNHNTKEHYYLEGVWPEIGDGNLLFVTFPKTDAPRTSWSQHATQHASVRTWGAREGYTGEFVRYTIEEISKDNYCKVSDGYNHGASGWYARDSFYKINKITKGG